MVEHNPESILRRAEDLSKRCQRQQRVLVSSFLTPPEQSLVHGWVLRNHPKCMVLFRGGREECERKLALFLPFDVEEASISYSDYIQSVKISGSCQTLSHRDYLGAILALGLKRETIGDIWVQNSDAYVFCTPTAAEFILQNLTQVGRCGVSVQKISLSSLPSQESYSVSVRFTVQSPRLDAIVRGIFHISRSDAVKSIAAGRVMLNYMPCLRPDMEVHEKDILSFRGHSKARISEFEGSTRRGRIIVAAEQYR
jgi:RNA-binding protein YlmH